jgi:murein L,D-transpeptidase YcbB/YkuD
MTRLRRFIGASVAGAALMALGSPAFAEEPAFAVAAAAPANDAVGKFYASRAGAPLWLRQGADSSAARELIGALERAPLDGLSNGPALATQAQLLLARAQTGDPAAIADADRFLSTAWVLYVEALQRPPMGMSFADNWAKPRQQSAQEILQRAANASSLAAHVRTISEVNPVYAQIRDAAWTQLQSTGGTPDSRVLASLDRIRATPFQKRYVIVDAGSARLWMVQDGRIVDSMKVIVGKPSAQTPAIASTIYYATLNPYWHVTPDLVRTLIAKNVLEQGYGYLKAHGYQLFTSYGDDAVQLSPDKVDWKAVVAGRQTVEVRQLPGPGNSMGHLKFGFANPYDIYLHDTPNKDLFAQDDRDLSHGCIRLEDAERLGRWMLGQELMPVSTTPEQHVTLPTPIPIYITYLTAQPNGGQLGFVDDVYGRDSVSAGS